MSGGATSTHTGESAATEEKSRLYRGHYVDSTEEETVLMFDLPSGKKWKKRIWPRKAYPKKLFRWNTAEEILSYLISFDHHDQWISSEVPHRPPSGTILFFDKTKRKMDKKTKARPSREPGTLASTDHLQAKLKDYRIDGYDWKTRRGSGYIREDRMKLKVSGFQLLYGCYTHCASNPNFHKRSYWLLQNPNLVMVHYLEVDPGPSMVEEEQDPAEVASSIVPTNWDLLTISDCNLCALLNMVNKADEIQGLMKQLTHVLGQNVQASQDLEQAIEMNNTGLPFDKFEESRSKKQRCRVFVPKKENPMMPTSSPSEDSSISMNASNEGLSDVPKMVSLNPPESKEQSMNQAAVSKVLSTTPHIILCFPKNSGMSYVFFNSALKMPEEAKMSGKKKPQGPSSKKSRSNESRSLNTNGKVGETGSLSSGSVQTPVGTESSRTHQGKGTRKGKEKASVPETRQDFPFFIPALQNLGNPAQVQTNSATNLATASAQFPLPRSHDYDPESFSKFASSLVSMDLEGLEGKVTGKASQFPQAGEPGPSGCNSLPSLVLGAEERAFFSKRGLSGGGGGGMHDLEASDEDSRSDSEEMELSYPDENHESLRVSNTPVTAMSWLLQPGSGEELAFQHMHSPMEDSLCDAASSSMVRESHLAVENGYGREPENKCMSSDTWESRDRISTQSCDHHHSEVPSDIPLELSPISLSPLFQFSGSSLVSRQNPDADLEESSQPLSPLSRLIESMTPTAIDETTHMLRADSSTKVGIASAVHPAETESVNPVSASNTSGLQTYPVSSSHPSNELSDFIPTTHTSMLIPYSQASVSHSQSSTSHSQTSVSHSWSSTSHSQPSVSYSQSSVSHSQTTSTPARDSFGPQWLEVGSSVPEVVVTSPSDNVWNTWQYCNPMSMPLWADSSPTAGGQGDASTSKHAQQEQIRSTGPLNSDALEIELPKEIADLVLYPELQSMGSPFHSNIPTHSQAIPSPCSISTPDTSYQERDARLENSDVHFTIAPPDPSTSTTSSPRTSECREPERIQSSSLGEPIPHMHSDSNLQQWDAPLGSGFHPHLEHTPTRSFSDAMLNNWNPSRTLSQNHPLSSSLGQLDARTSRASHTGSLGSHSLFHSLQVPHLSLNLDRASSTSSNRRSSRPQSLSPLEDITEGVQMELPVLAQLRRENLGEGEMNLFHEYRTSSSVPSSPSVASVSSQSTISLFDAGDSPSVLELCELLSESPNVHESDFSHMPLSDDEQKQLFRAAHIIQNAFRKYKHRRQMRMREKQAALLIENYYKRYKEVKQQKDFAARRIQHQYRVYKSRIRELNRAAVFIQQMYRFHKARRDVHEAKRHVHIHQS